ncbi:MAG: hypothetical protein NTX92_09010 [Euryarchaeota archaeon]|nr:hypothetical protein [Euryarchaeota archaeon]
MKSVIYMGIFKFEFVKRASSKSVCEDELTSRVFGILELAGEDILPKWLGIHNFKTIDFWPKGERADPDLIIYDSSGKSFIIECKLTDYGSVNQLKREYNLAHGSLGGNLIFITANISRPDIVIQAEKELGLKQGEIHWTTWTNLHSIITDLLKNNKIKDPVKKELLTQCKEYLRWLRMGHNLGELMEHFKEAFQEGWLEIVSEKFKDFNVELKQSLETKTMNDKRYQHIRVATKIKSDLFQHTWINLYSKDVKKVNSKLYYFIYFDIREYDWTIILAGETKPVRVKIKEFLEKQNIQNFTLEESLSGGHDIGYRVINSNPDFRKPDKIKKELIDKSLEFINEMNLILAKYKK